MGRGVDAMRTKIAALVGVLLCAFAIWLAAPMVKKAIPKCWDSHTYNLQTVDPKTGRVTDIGPFKATDVGCPKPGAPIHVMTDQNGNPLDINGQPLRPGGKPAVLENVEIGEPTITKNANGGTIITFPDDRPYWWEPTETQRLWLCCLAAVVAVMSFVFAWRLRQANP
jgi:hypothetical protein